MRITMIKERNLLDFVDFVKSKGYICQVYDDLTDLIKWIIKSEINNGSLTIDQLIDDIVELSKPELLNRYVNRKDIYSIQTEIHRDYLYFDGPVEMVRKYADDIIDASVERRHNG